MKRGDIYFVAGGAGPAEKPRPCVIIQRSSTLDDSPKVTVCPITSHIRVASPIRPLVHPTVQNGLVQVSQIEVDWMFTYRAERLLKRIGEIDETTMRQVDEALRRWLDL